jgi:hypothetical protein
MTSSLQVVEQKKPGHLWPDYSTAAGNRSPAAD